MKRLACLALLAACTAPGPSAGDPSISTGEGPWLIGQTNNVNIEWLAAFHCDTSIPDCDSQAKAVLQVNSATCDGCAITNTYAGGVSGGIENLPAVAQRDGAITITATVTFVPTGDQRTLTTTVQGDHEVALGADCAWMWADQVQPSLEGNYEPTFPCEATRRPDQAVLITPFVQTARGAKLYPFEPEGTMHQSPNPDARAFSAITTSVAPDQWTFSSAVYMTTGGPVTLSARLSSGGTSTTTVVLPRVCDPTKPCMPLPPSSERE